MLNMDFSQRVVIRTAEQPWVAAPPPGLNVSPWPGRKPNGAMLPALFVTCRAPPLLATSIRGARKSWFSRGYSRMKPAITRLELTCAIRPVAGMHLTVNKAVRYW